MYVWLLCMYKGMLSCLMILYDAAQAHAMSILTTIMYSYMYCIGYRMIFYIV